MPHDTDAAAIRFTCFARLFRAAALAAGALLAAAGATAQTEQPAGAPTAPVIPSNPRTLLPEGTTIIPPRLADHRRTLRVEGRPDIPLLLMPDDDLPIVDITFAFRGGVELEPTDRAGLTRVYTNLLRLGGAGGRSPEELEAFLGETACRLNTQVGARITGVSVDCLSTELDEAMSLLRDVLYEPGFDAGRLIAQKQELLRALMQQNSSPAGIARIHMNRIAYGADHPAAKELTQATVSEITPDDLRRYHATVARPERLVIAVRGDFDPEDLRRRLAEIVRDWPAWSEAPYALEPSTQTLAPGLYHVSLGQPGVTQALGIVVNRTVSDLHPDAPLLELASQILGGGGEQSRMTRAIQARAGARQNVGYTAFVQSEQSEASLFGGFYQAPAGSALLVAEIALDEYRAIADGASPITDAELAQAKDAMRELMWGQLGTSAQRLSAMAQAVILDRPAEAWASRLERIESATPADVARAIREHLLDQPTALLVAGDWSVITDSPTANPDALAERLGGPVTALPALDPMTLQPVSP